MTHEHVGNQNRMDRPLDFLWLELTNRCNLQCTHCYAESGPDADVSNQLSAGEHEHLLRQAFDLGCRKVQFIGGEPTLNKDLGKLVAAASGMGYEFIEIFSNLTRLPDDLLHCIKKYNVCVATSVHAPTEAVHDRITRTAGSFSRTIGNLRKLVANGISARVAMVAMAENASLADSTVAFLKDDVGVYEVKVDYQRPFGRASGAEAQLQNLCGACASDTLCIGPSEEVSPCIMSRKWGVGSVKSQSLVEIVSSNRLSTLRNDIGRAVSTQRGFGPDDFASTCDPSADCGPQVCNPVISCHPIDRQPNIARHGDSRAAQH
ncbi:MAG: radical SAM protein [Nitrosospira sp.]